MFETVPTSVAAPIFQVGILYAQTGALASRERSCIQATLMAIDEINQQGGLLGHSLLPRVGDTASCATGFVAQARHLIVDSGISTLFGGSTAEMRQASLSLLAAHDALLWYPARCEGMEAHPQVFYTGLCLNQFVLAALDWLTQYWDSRLYCIGTEGFFAPLQQSLVRSELWPGALAGEAWVAPGETDFSDCLAEIAALRPAGIISGLEGDSNLAFFRQYEALRQSTAAQPAAAAPIFALGLTAADVIQLGEAAVGHYGVGGYFSTLETVANQAFVERFRSRYGSAVVITEAEHTAYSQVYLWKQAVETSQSFQPDALRPAAYGQTFAAPAGGLRLETNHYVQQHCWIAQVSPEQEFCPVTEASPPLAPEPWLGAEQLPQGPLITQLLAQVSASRQVQRQSAAEHDEQQRLVSQLKLEVSQRQRLEQQVRLLLAIRQVVEQADTARDALTGAIQCISQETGWPYGELWLPDENHLHRSTIWYLDEAHLSHDETEVLYRFRDDSNPTFQKVRAQFLRHVWSTEKAHWTRSLWADSAALENSNQKMAHITNRVVGIPIFATHSAGCWEEIIDDNDESSKLQPRKDNRQVLGILLFALPQVRPQDRRFVDVVSTVAAQVGTIVQQKKSEEMLRKKNTALAIALDQLRTTQDELMYSEKMSALGHFVAGIAHEINTPLGAISASVDSIAGFIAQELEQLTDFPPSLLPEQQELLNLLILRAAGDNAYISSRERRQQRRSLLSQLTTASIPKADTLAEILLDLKAHDKIEQLLPMLRDLNTQAFLNRLHRLVDLFQSTQDIAMASERVSKVTFSLKTYTQADSVHQRPELTNVAADIDKVVALYQNRLQQSIAVVRRFDADIPPLRCYADELTQVWVHLIYNAIQAMETSPIVDHVLRLEIERSHDDLVVRITDSGDGIPTELHEKIFEPFFTTKPAGEGSGLGLNIVRKIVEKHGGAIAVDSWPGETMFVVRLPFQRFEHEA